jgi:hypothetical protein
MGLEMEMGLSVRVFAWDPCVGTIYVDSNRSLKQLSLRILLVVIIVAGVHPPN